MGDEVQNPRELTAERPIEVGDYVIVKRSSGYPTTVGLKGRVTSIGGGYRYHVALRRGGKTVAEEVERVEPAREEPAHDVGDVWRHEDGREASVCVASTGLCGCVTLSLRDAGSRGVVGTPERLERDGWRRVRCAGGCGRGK